jgi:hypothetical protein
VPKQTRTRPVNAAQARAYVSKAEEYLSAATAELGADRPIAATSLAIHAADKIPAGREALPLAEKDRRLAGNESPRVGLEELEGAGGVESVDGARPPAGGDRLTDALGALERERRERREQLVELIIDDPREVLVGHVAT